MSGDYVLAIEGLESLEDIANLPADVLRNARNAINKAADRARTSSDREIRKELNFPAQYLRDRLTVRKRASGSTLEAIISGRDRPTSLARFVTSRSPKIGKAGVNVKVSSSIAKRMNLAFVMKLRSGNLGLAIRLKPGARLTGSRGAKQFSSKDSNLYLLYGPSVDQAFKTILPGQEEATAEYLEREFLRLMDL